MSESGLLNIEDLADLLDGVRQGDDEALSSPKVREQPRPCPYDTLSYLIVEDSSTMRAWLRGAIADAGGKRIDQAESYSDALYRVRTRGGYDVVLCDYILSDTRDGQQLLEEVRRSRLLPQATIWLMITGERTYEQVFSAAELAPDDYLLKPITPAIFHERLGRAWDRQQALKTATALYDKGAFADALIQCRTDLISNTRHTLAFQRLIGDCLLQLEHYQEAFDHFDKLLFDRPTLPWAKLGKAKAFFHLDRHDESQEILRDLMDAHPDFLHAHDLMAKVHERKGEIEETKELLKLVLQKNPKALHRHREVIRVALATGDDDSAIEAFALMHQHGRGSSFIQPGDFCSYAAMLSKSGSRSARDRLENLACNLRDFHKEGSTFAFADRMVKFSVAKHAGDAQAMADAYREMVKAEEAARGEGAAFENEESMVLLEAALAMNDKEVILRMASALYADYVGNESMVRRIDRLMQEGGMEQHATALIAEATENLKRLNMAAVELAKQGRMLDAVEEFTRLADGNRNLAVILNAATAILKCFEEQKNGRMKLDITIHRKLSNRLEGYLNFVRSRDPGNLKLEKIQASYRALM